MVSPVFDNAFLTAAGKIGAQLNEAKLNQLGSYLDQLLKWNQHFNLFGASTTNAIVNRHLLDSLAISPHLAGKVILDVGTGAGLPGIPLAIAHPEKSFILLDSNGKKTRFLFQVKTALKLVNVTVENCRIEHYESERQIDCVTSRAFASLQDMAEKTQHLLHKQTMLLAMKGKYPTQEIEDLPETFKVLESTALQIPGEEAQRHLITLALA